MEKSKDFAERLGSDFTPSTGWLARWKNRMGIKIKRAHGEKSSADEAAAENWFVHKLPKLLEEFPETDIFNADETGLFYTATRICRVRLYVGSNGRTNTRHISGLHCTSKTQ